MYKIKITISINKMEIIVYKIKQRAYFDHDVIS